MRAQEAPIARGWLITSRLLQKYVMKVMVIHFFRNYKIAWIWVNGKRKLNC